MDKFSYSGLAIASPCVCFLNMVDSFKKIFKRTCDCKKKSKVKYVYSCDICKNPIKHSTKRIAETIGFATLGCVFIIPGIIGVVGYIPEKIIHAALYKEDMV